MTVKELDVKARWFAGKARRISSVERVDAVGPLTLASVLYADAGPDERYLVFAAVDWAGLIATLSSGPVRGASGRLELRGEARLDGATSARVPSLDQTNTLVALGERVLVKAYRRLEAGVHPEIELLAALSAADAPVPRFHGSLHYVDDRGEDTALACLCAFVPGAEGGWEAPIERVAAHLRGSAAPPLGEFAAAGAAAARVHAALATELRVRPATSSDADEALTAARAALAEAAARDPELEAASASVLRGLRPLERLAGSQMQRIHGDLHYAQLLRPAASSREAGPSEPLVIDFEGDPTVPLAERRRPGSPLHDLACLLRSIDHIGSAAARRVSGAPPDEWIATATDAALAGYGADVDRPLLSALELAKEVAEFVYAQRVLPEWTYAPRAGLRRLLERGARTA